MRVKVVNMDWDRDERDTYSTNSRGLASDNSPNAVLTAGTKYTDFATMDKYCV